MINFIYPGVKSIFYPSEVYGIQKLRQLSLSSPQLSRHET